jgi:hypothetical protein
MKLRFFNGRDETEDSERLDMLNKAIRESGLQFAPFELEGTAVASFDQLCERMAVAPSPAEAMIAMLHLTGCPGLASEISKWNIDLRRNLVVVLFSGDSLSEATVRSIVRAGQGGRIARVLWLNRGLLDVVSTAEFKAFFAWLAAERNPTLEAVCEEFAFRLRVLNCGTEKSASPANTLDAGVNNLTPQELLRPITLLCEGALAVHEARSKANTRVPQIAFKTITEPHWWRECLGLATRESAENILIAELRPKLPSKLERTPPPLEGFLAAIFSESPISEETVRAARDYCSPIAW